MANAAQLKRISDCLESDRLARHGSGGRTGAGHEARTRSGPALAAYSANGYAIAGHRAYTEPVAETFPLRGNHKGGGGNLQDMESRPLGTSSVRDRRNMALGVASGFAVVWFLVKWVAENKLDAFGWGGAFALIADYFYPWTPKVAKLMTFIL